MGGLLLIGPSSRPFLPLLLLLFCQGIERVSLLIDNLTKKEKGKEKEMASKVAFVCEGVLFSAWNNL